MRTLRVTVDVMVSENDRPLNERDTQFLVGVVYKAVDRLRTALDPTGEDSMVKFVSVPKVAEVS